MQTKAGASKRVRAVVGRSLRSSAVAACLWPGVAAAQTWNPTASDVYGNTAAGSGALTAHTAGGIENTAIGSQALKANTGYHNTAAGVGALGSNTSGGHNTAAGHLALFRNTTGSYNTATGIDTLLYNVTGGYNTADGAAALRNNTDGSFNTAGGVNALFANTTGGYNTAGGAWALYANTTGGYNTAGGAWALQKNTTGRQNTAVGTRALAANTTGLDNTAVGYGALYSLTTGVNNTAIGMLALRGLSGNSTGNIAIGPWAGSAVKFGNRNIYIGNGGNNESNVTRIGSVQTRTFIAGIAGVPLSGATVVVNSKGQLGVVASSARYKMDVAPLATASQEMADKLARLRPVSYRYEAEPEAKHYGLIAEEVDAVMPEIVVRDDESRPESVQYQELIPLLLQQWKAQRAMIERQQAEVERQRGLIDRQQTELAELRRSLATRLSALGEAGDAVGR